VKNNDGKTPLDLALEAGHEKASLLLGEGITKRFKKGLE
jgi:ankyrin repeat protein